MKLSDLCFFVSEKTDVDTLNLHTYISTENMLPDKKGVTKASSLPTISKVNAYMENDILVSNIRPYFKKIWKARFCGGCSNDVLVFRATPKCHSGFLYYVLSDDCFFNYVTGTSKGTKMPRGDKVAIMEYSVPDVSLSNQYKIASVLSSLDSKIEQNTAINNNLEQQAQALFQQYFGSKGPNGSINDILDEMPKSKIKVGDAKDVRGPYPFFTSGQNILEYTEALVDGRNIFLNTGGNADVKYYIGPAAYSTDTWCIKAKNNMTDMLYLLLKGMQTELDSIYFEGSALRHLQKPKLKSLAIYIPTDEELNTFNSIVASLFNKIAANVSENKILEHTRDALLPRLMSGEIDVSEVDVSDPSCLDKSLFILFSDACAGRFFDLLPFAQIYVGCGGVTTSDDRLNCHHLSCGLLPLIHVLSDRRQNTA